MEKQFAGMAVVHYEYSYVYSSERDALLFCSYHKSLVGQDYKTWAQMGIFVSWPFLVQEERNVWLALVKV